MRTLGYAQLPSRTERWGVGRSGVLLLLALMGALSTACAGAPVIDDADLDVRRHAARATALLAQPTAAAEGHLDLAWLCLLHGHQCGALRRHADAAVQGAGDMALAQLTRALARQTSSDIRARATAWLDLLLWASHDPDLHSRARLTTLALDVLQRLARRDRAGVRQALGAHHLTGPTLVAMAARTAVVELRLRRMRSLTGWLPLADQSAIQMGRPPQVVTMDARPFGRRIYADLARITANAPVGETLALSIASARPLPRVRLPLPGPAGVYRVHVRWRDVPAGRWTLAVRTPRLARVWLEGTQTGSNVGAAVRAGETWLLPLTPRQSDQKVGARSAPGVACTIALSLTTEGGSLSVALVPRGASPAQRLNRGESADDNRQAENAHAAATGRLAALVVSMALGAQGGQRVVNPYPAGPLAALLALTGEPQGPALRHALDRTLDQLPNHVDARLDRARLARNQSQVGLARRLLEPLARRAHSDPALARRSDLHLEVANLRQLDGLGDLAVAAAERAIARQPGDCATYWQAVEIASDALDRDALRRMAGDSGAVDCRAQQPLKMAALLAAVGRSQSALTLLKKTSQRRGWSRRARARARALAPGLQAPWAWRGASAATRAARASAEALVQGRKTMARAAWTRILLGRGATPTQRRGAWLLGAQPPWVGQTVDGRAWVKTHPVKPTNGASVTWLLDHEIVVPLPGGGALRRVHQIVRVHTAGAAESVGELSVPADAELVLARTHTTDGRVVAPADTPDKESISLREVTPGAAVEYVQVQFLGPADPATGATRLPAFLLQSRDGPVVISRYEVFDRPGGAKADHPRPRVDVSATAPAATARRHGAWRVRRWQLQDAPRFRLEPRANRPAWNLAAVRTSVGATQESVVGPWADVLAAQAARYGVALKPWLLKAKQAGDSHDRWQALVAELVTKIGHQRTGLGPGSPSTAVRNGKGDRASLLVHLARSAGVRACLVRIRPWSREPAYGAPDPADFRLSAVQLWLRKGQALKPVWIDPGVDGSLFDYLRAGLRRRSAVRVGCDPALPVQLTTPNLGAAADRRDVSISLVWHADGSVDAEVQDTLRGALATIVRNVLRGGHAGPRKSVLRQLSSATFPAMKATWVGGTRLQNSDPHTPLVLRYRVHGDAAAHRQTRLLLGLTPYRLGRRYGTLARRRMTLRFGHQLNVHVTLQVRSVGRALLKPVANQATHRLAQLSQEVTLKHGRLHISHTLQATMGLVQPGDYRAFAQVVRTADRAEKLVLRRSPVLNATPK